ncbi:MAG: sodium ion-translocating decarboxylase subunit beta [Victivallales bacterium]|nr:sodium ion-translocating decarboxylase subunit beta [Victivallales bacterium]
MMNRLMKCLAVMFCAALVSTSFADAAKDNEAEQAALQKLQFAGVQMLTNDGVLATVQKPDGTVDMVYVWSAPAVVYQVACRAGQAVVPGRTMFILKFKDAEGVPHRSKGEIKAAMGYKVNAVNFDLGNTIQPGQVICNMTPQMISHDSVTASESKDISFKEMMIHLWESTGIYDFIHQTTQEWTLGLGRLIMIGVGILLLYLGIFRGFEPLLLVPIGFGAIMSNIPLAGIAEPDGILGILFQGVTLGIYPLLIFLGIGAMTDFGPLIANPVMSLLGGAAQLGIFVALFGAVLLDKYCPGIHFSIKDAASIGIIGGADGPTAIFISSRLSPNLLGSIAVAAYSYMALVPIIQPPIIRLLTTPEQRKVRMAQLRKVTKLEKVVFPLIITLLCCLLLPSAAPLIGMLMLGNLMKECMVVDRLSDTAQNALINIVTIFLGLSVGSKLSADKFLNLETLGILLLGLVAFSFGTAGGVWLGKLFYRLSGGKVNPMIGAAGVSAVPMAARVVNKVGLEEDPQNFLLMQAMGPNVSGVIGSAVVAGVLLCALG